MCVFFFFFFFFFVFCFFFVFKRSLFCLCFFFSFCSIYYVRFNNEITKSKVDHHSRVGGGSWLNLKKKEKEKGHHGLKKNAYVPCNLTAAI